MLATVTLWPAKPQLFTGWAFKEKVANCAPLWGVGLPAGKGAGPVKGQGEVPPAGVWLVGYVSVSHEMDSNLSISLKMSYGVLECDIVMSQHHMLMIF